MALRTMSQSEPDEVIAIFCCCMMSNSCVRTSLAFFNPADCRQHCFKDDMNTCCQDGPAIH